MHDPVTGGPASGSLTSSNAATGSPATDASIALLTEFVRLGVRDIVLSPGSRSQALALVAAELERVGAIRLHVRIDERVAGFLALGLAVESGMPALVITTSGTATANLHPAVLEAHHSAVPMILLTADRPVELRGIRSNQTTMQAGMYAGAVRLLEDVAAPVGAAGEADAMRDLARTALHAATGMHSRNAGPVQLNLGYREPLSAVVPDLSEALARATTRTDAGEAAGIARASGVAPSSPIAPASRPAIVLAPGPRTLVVAGHGAGPGAEELARAGGWPLAAEVSSGARFGPNLVVAYRELLNDADFGGRVERAIVFGHPTLSREVPTLLTRDGVETIVVAPGGDEVYNPGRRAAQIASAVVVAEGTDPSARAAREWVGRWVFASRAIADETERASAALASAPDLEAARSTESSRRLAFARSELAVVREPVTRHMLVSALWRYTWPHDRLVLGASRLIRDADRTVPGKKIRVHSNRGLAGIDGTVATAIGVALASAGNEPRAVGVDPGVNAVTDVAESGASGVTRLLLGDITLLHDVGALLFGEGERRPHLQVVVGNDGGGTIFDALEVAWTAPAAALDRVMYTPQRVDVSALATAYGWHYARATTRGELDQALSAPAAGVSILEVPLTR
ncbi:MAG: 2-succinyl-5-enolpyruvyl-6-hydroxy-3-cyclohexene-carboxylate synthase [Microbacteriaceae bacterium]|nr:2-succinyl-5-enolpyruvyl-6-hydroxy-3-cyclohexene-carboxylate synthase [Microbacteriaceae bacterium]